MAALVGAFLLTACGQVPRHGYTSASSSTMAYALSGPEKAPVVVLQSGLGDGRTSWKPERVVQALERLLSEADEPPRR